MAVRYNSGSVAVDLPSPRREVVLASKGTSRNWRNDPEVKLLVAQKKRSTILVATRSKTKYPNDMANLNIHEPIPSTDETSVDAETVAAIQRGLKAAEEGRLFTSDEVRTRVSQWISNYSTQNPR